jgi:hypothetical protein
MTFLVALAAAVAWTSPFTIKAADPKPELWSADQHAEADFVWPRVQSACPDKDCINKASLEMLTVLNSLGELDYRFGFSGIADRAREHCRPMINDFSNLIPYAVCMKELATSDEQTVVMLLDYRTYGVTCEGYEALETRMRYGEAKIVLGRYGTQLSRAEVGGQSSSTYEWRTRAGSLIVIIQNGRIAAKSQSNLCR